MPRQAKKDNIVILREPNNIVILREPKDLNNIIRFFAGLRMTKERFFAGLRMTKAGAGTSRGSSLRGAKRRGNPDRKIYCAPRLILDCFVGLEAFLAMTGRGVETGTAGRAQ